jgi:predicted Zn-dependent protease
MGSTVFIQRNFQDIVNEWTYSIDSLPENFNDEEMIKLKYAEVLISNGMLKRAKEFIDKQKTKLPNEKWYEMLVNIAYKNEDATEIERVYKELNSSKAPIVNEDIED